MSERRDAKGESAVSATLFAELLYAEPPSPDVGGIAGRVTAALPQTELISDVTRQGIIHFAHTDHTVTTADGKVIPAQTAVITPDRPADPSGLMADLQQTYDWPEAKKVAPRCRYPLLVTEFLARWLDHQT